MRVRFILTVCLGLLAAFPCGCGQEDRPDQADKAKRPDVLIDSDWPNVLLISLDSVRADHLGCYGYDRETSPRIDQLASEGALFETSISASSWTLPTHASLFTGLATSIHGLVDMQHQLDNSHITLAKDLKSAGYAAVGFVSSPLLQPVFGLAQGFDGYYRCLSPVPKDEKSIAANATSPTVLAAVNGWLSQNTHKPFFMFVNLWDAHFDYTPPAPFDTRFDPDYRGAVNGRGFLTDPRINKDMPERDLEHLIALYDGEIAWVDAHVGLLLDMFKSAGLLDTTIVVLTSSHGTAFFEHDLKGQRNALYDELIKVPLIIRYPQSVPAGKRYAEQARTIDLYPTISDLIGMAVPAVMGRSLAPLFKGESIDTRGGIETALSELVVHGQRIQAIRHPQRKTIFFLETDGGIVFDLVADPGELSAVSDAESPVVKGARADTVWTQKIFLAQFRGKYPPAQPLSGLPPGILEKLNALGYVEGQLPAPSDKP